MGQFILKRMAHVKTSQLSHNLSFNLIFLSPSIFVSASISAFDRDEVC